MPAKKSKKSWPHVKGITRIDDPGRHGVGWYARVTYNGKTHSKYLADASHGGTEMARTSVIKWRDAKEKELGKPRTDRIVPPVSTRNRTGVPGVYQSRESFVVAWSPMPGEIRREFVSITEHGEEEALRLAVELRRKRERAVYGRAVSTTEQLRSRRSRKRASARSAETKARLLKAGLRGAKTTSRSAKSPAKGTRSGARKAGVASRKAKAPVRASKSSKRSTGSSTRRR
ncbi:MAG TPA: hypothetical protein VNM92_10210 [Thermoanaerobaculia bacterium]|nr:hypothetical protein [Thermoanaerobaculia bacterium]